MRKVRVAFLGSRPLGHFALSLLQSMDDVEIVSVVTKKPPASAWWDKDPSQIAKNYEANHSGLNDVEFDLGVSINYWKIIEPRLIQAPSLGFINLHHSYNLCLRGRNMTSHAILSARRLNRWYHGTTLHYTDDGLDTGPIIASRACEITEADTSLDLFQRVESLGEELLREWLPRIKNGRVPSASPMPGHPLHYKLEENDRYIPDIHLDPLYSYDHVRAFDFNGHYPMAFTFQDGHQTNLTTDPALARKPLLDAGNGRLIYSARSLI